MIDNFQIGDIVHFKWHNKILYKIVQIHQQRVKIQRISGPYSYTCNNTPIQDIVLAEPELLL